MPRRCWAPLCGDLAKNDETFLYRQERIEKAKPCPMVGRVGYGNRRKCTFWQFRANPADTKLPRCLLEGLCGDTPKIVEAFFVGRGVSKRPIRGTLYAECEDTRKSDEASP